MKSRMEMKPIGAFGSKHYENLRLSKPHYLASKTQKTTHKKLLCNYFLHHKLTGFIGSFQIHVKLIVSWGFFFLHTDFMPLRHV
jgi:hypothetical protein